MLTSKNEGGADFSGLSAKLEQRSHNGLFYLVNYQWSKNLDNNSGEADANDTSYSTHFSFDRSYSNFDTQSRAVASGGYELPFGKGKPFLNAGVANVIAGGWQVQPIVQLRSGFPFSVTAGSGSCTCGTYVPQRPNLAPGRTNGTLAAQPTKWFDTTAYIVPIAGVQGTVTRNASAALEQLSSISLPSRILPSLKSSLRSFVRRHSTSSTIPTSVTRCRNISTGT